MKKIMEGHTSLTPLVMFVLVGMAILAATPAQQIRAQLTDNNAIARYTQQLMNKLNLCQDNPFRSHEIPPIVIPGISPGKNGGIAIYGNANATEHGQNGAISIGGGYNDKSSSAHPYNGNLVIRGGNGGIAFCGTANGENATNGG
jgi:hypothetical protein